MASQEIVRLRKELESLIKLKNDIISNYKTQLIFLKDKDKTLTVVSEWFKIDKSEILKIVKQEGNVNSDPIRSSHIEETKPKSVKVMIKPQKDRVEELYLKFKGLETSVLYTKISKMTGIPRPSIRRIINGYKKTHP